MTAAMIASPANHMIAPPVRVSDNRFTDSPGSASMPTACVPCSSTTPVKVSTAIATASSSHLAGAASRHRIGSSPTTRTKNWMPART